MLPDIERVSLESILVRTRRRMIAGDCCDALGIGWIVGIVAAIALMVTGLDARWAFMVPMIAVVLPLLRRPSLEDAAGLLDRSHQLQDLIGSAWGVRHLSDEPWARYLLVDAERRLATIEPLPLPTRFPLRWHATPILIWAAMWVIPSASMAPAMAARQNSDITAVVHSVADMHVATALPVTSDNSESSSRLPSEAKVTGGLGDGERSHGGGDARGSGRADVASADSIPLPVSSGSLIARVSAGAIRPASGEGASDASAVNDYQKNTYSPIGSVQSTRSSTMTGSLAGSPPPQSPTSTTPNTPPPAPYRPLIQDFFNH